MTQKSIVIAIAIAVLTANLLTGVIATSQIVYADDSSDTEINIKEKRELI
jgi:ligand-binding sensor protein